MAETPTSESLPVARLLGRSPVIASGVPEGLDAAVLGTLSRLVATLAELANDRGGSDETPLIVLTTVNAVLQRVPPHEFFAASMQRLAPGNAVSMAELIERLEHVGYGRAGTVTD